MSETSVKKKFTKDPAAKQPIMTTRNLVLSGMFAAVLAVVSQISVPMPTGVPVTIQVFGIALTGAVLGWRLGVLATMVYILIGAAGLPVFSGFQGGVQVLTGVTGGYILGWPVMAALCGVHLLGASKRAEDILSLALSLTGLMIVEFIGGLQWTLLAGEKSLGAIMAYSFVAFIPKDIVITVLGVLTGRQMRKMLQKTGYSAVHR